MARRKWISIEGVNIRRWQASLTFALLLSANAAAAQGLASPGPIVPAGWLLDRLDDPGVVVVQVEA